MCGETENSIINDLFDNALLPIIVASVTYFLFNRLDEYKRRKNQSILGVVIMECLIEEVKNGSNIINSVLDPNNKTLPNISLPRKSWSGISTIPDDVLLRIIGVSKNVSPTGFKPREIRIHTKNYFEHMVGNWDSLLSIQGDTKQAAIHRFPTYGQAATGVLNMLIQTKELLEENSKRWFPK
jgi:hypothetical protein